MKGFLTTIILFLYFIASAAAQGKDLEKLIRDLEKEDAAAVLTHDTTTLEKLWSDDFTVNTPANIIGTRKRGDQIRLYYSALDRNIEKVIIFNDFTVITMGNEVVTPKGEMPMAGQTLHRRYTNIWLKRDGKWQLASRHANLICPQTK